VLGALLLCVAAAVGYNAGAVLQSSGAYGSGDERLMQPSLFLPLLRVRSWVTGVVLNLAGWGFQVWGLTVASLTFVQPALGTGVLFLLGFAWLVLGQRPTPRDLLSALALASGIGVLSRVAPAAHTGTGALVRWIAAGVVLAVFALAPLVLRMFRRVPGPLWLAVSVGFAFALTGLSSEVVSRAIHRHDVALLAGAVGVTALFGFVGFLSETSALVTGNVTAVVAAMTAVDTVIPVALAPFLFGEHWPHSPARITLLAAGLILAIGGAVSLAASPRVTQTRTSPDAATQSAATGR